MARRLAAHDLSLGHGPGFLGSSNHRAGEQVRSTAQTGQAKGCTYAKQAFEKARLAFGSVSTAAQLLARADRVTQKLLR